MNQSRSYAQTPPTPPVGAKYAPRGRGCLCAQDRKQPTEDTTTTIYTLAIRSLPSAVPSSVRLRRVLKSLLRAYSFRCVDFSASDKLASKRMTGKVATEEPCTACESAEMDAASIVTERGDL